MAPPFTPQLISALNPGPMTGAGNNTWLIDGAEPTLIDAGTGVPAHVEAVARALGSRPLRRLLVTHGHPDHISGTEALRAVWPTIDACKFLVAPEPGWRGLTAGERVGAGDTELMVIYTPGHAEDHICFWHPPTRDLFAGDMLLAGTTVMIPAGHGGNLGDYLASLDRLLALAPVRVLPGHGAVIDQPAALVRQYLEHRRQREVQVLDAVEAGDRDIDAIVDRVYPVLDAELRPAARSTVFAHLEKLRQEGRLPAGVQLQG